MIWGMWGHFHQSEGQITVCQTSHHQFGLFAYEYFSDLFTMRCKGWAGPEQEKIPQQTKAVAQMALLLGPYDPADAMGLEVSVVGKHTVKFLASPNKKITAYPLRVLEQVHAICSEELHITWKSPRNATEPW